jgi:hypothetical protein
MHRMKSLILSIGAAVLFAMTCPATAQQRFKTPEEAADTLAAAARAGDRRALALVFGRGSLEIIASGDRAADDEMRRNFVAAYDAGHRIKIEGTSATLLIGKNEWPFPIPLAQDRDVWRFNTAAGRGELLARRIGRNELAAKMALLAYVDAQNEYAEMDAAGGGMGVYAQKIASTLGKKDGLYWPAAQGEPESPLGEFVAAASQRGPVGGDAPFHGYYYRILTSQGPAAPGGERKYVVRGKMIGGFAMVAYPAEYGNSGVMTFLVNKDGDVFEKDLGSATGRAVWRMSAFNPDHTWRKVVDTQEP